MRSLRPPVRHELVSLDLDLTDPVRFPPVGTAGVVVLRVRDRPGRHDLDEVVSRLLEALTVAPSNLFGPCSRMRSAVALCLSVPAGPVHLVHLESRRLR
jgi:hypothetical protein